MLILGYYFLGYPYFSTFSIMVDSVWIIFFFFCIFLEAGRARAGYPYPRDGAGRGGARQIRGLISIVHGRGTHDPSPIRPVSIPCVYHIQKSYHT